MINNRYNKYFIFQIVLNIRIDSTYVNRSYKISPISQVIMKRKQRWAESIVSRVCMRRGRAQP